MKILTVLLIFLIIGFAYARINDPYSILGVGKQATTQEIKRAYKQLVKEWHPDKNRSPDAESKFIEISEAYKLLSDSERRHRYDTTGQTEDQPNFRSSGQGDFQAFRNHDPFQSFFAGFGGSGGPGGGGGYKFNFKFGDTMSIYHQQSVNFKAYESVISGRSRKQPYLILFYSDWCVACSHIEPIWRRLVEELEPINFGIATVHAGRELELVRKVGVKTVPYLIMLLDSHPYHYREPSLSMASSLEFIKARFSPKLVQRVDASNIDDFLAGWMDNRVRVVIFGRLDIIRLRYLTVAWEFRERAAIAYCQIGLRSTESVVSRYSVSSKVDTLLIFREDPTTPAAAVAMGDLPYPTMKDIIESHQYLTLPRLSSQAVFDGLCPVSPSRGRRHFCAVLFTENSPSDDAARDALRQYAASRHHKPDSAYQPYGGSEHSQQQRGAGGGDRHRHQVNYAYIFQEKQTHFVNALVGVSLPPSEIHHHVVILWRTDHRRIKFTWVPERWETTTSTTQEPHSSSPPVDGASSSSDSPVEGEGQQASGPQLSRDNSRRFNLSSAALTASLEKLLNTDLPLPYETEVQELFDEHAQGIVWRILTRLSHWQEAFWQSLTKDDLYMIASMLVTVAVIVAVGFLMHYKVKKEEEYLTSKGINLNSACGSAPAASRSPQLPIHELRGETYNGLVRLLKPGCRTIVLLCDTHTKPKLISKFYKACWPYRKNKTLMFGFMNMERQSAMEWYKRILVLGLPEPRELNINPKNTIGTVVALNGHRKYYCLYHAKHPEENRKKGELFGDAPGLRRRRTGSESESDTSGSDVEVGSKKKDAISTDRPLLNYYSSVLFEEQLLEGFSLWLDRLFEGTTHRYSINYWPDWPGK